MYPIVVFVFAIGVMTAMLVFVVPTFVGIFSRTSAGSSRSSPQITMSASNVVKTYWYLLFGAGFGAVFMFKRWRKTDGGRRTWERSRSASR